MRATRGICFGSATLAFFLGFCVLVSAAGFDINTVTKARCYANCITQVSKSSIGDPGCQGDQCSQKNASLCHQSCQFLNDMKNWTSILTGDGSTFPVPGTPVVNATSTNAISLTLSWKLPVNVTGSVVYLLKKRFTGNGGNRNGQADLPLVLTEPKAVINTDNACLNIPMPTLTSDWNDFTFYFVVVALTENSSLVTGAESQGIVMPKIDPITSVVGPSFAYDAASNADKLKLTISVTPPSAYVSDITYYGIDWKSNCKQSPRKKMSYGTSTNFSMYIFQKIKACNHTLKIYSFATCIVSKPKIVSYTYTGCRYVENYNQSLCYYFDPPATPNSARAVGNLSYSPFEISPDYTFNTRVTWSRPSFPYFSPTLYYVSYGNPDNVIAKIFWIPEKSTDTKSTYIDLTGFKPQKKVRFQIRPKFPVEGTIGTSKNIYFTTPGLPDGQLLVQNVTVGDFGLSSSNMYVVNISWVKPKFNYSSIVHYLIAITKGTDPRTTLTTNNTYYEFSDLEHKEPVKFEVKTIYKHSWITSNFTTGQFIAPTPNEQQLKVRNLKNGEFVKDAVTTLYTAVLTWDNSSFKPVNHYKVSYALSGYNAVDCPAQDKLNNTGCQPATTENTSYRIPGIHPREHIVFSVTPVFKNASFIKGMPTTIKIDAPVPSRDMVRVQNLTYERRQIENSTEWANFFWGTPLFQHSDVAHYNVKYELKKTVDNNPSVKKVKRRSVQGNTTGTTFENITKATYFSAPELQGGEEMTFQVTPVFINGLIVGEKAELRISKPIVPGTPDTSLSPLELAGLTIGILVLVALVLILVLWFVERRRQLIKKGLIPGINGGMIDHWEVPMDKVLLDEELGEGAFGKVFKGTLIELPEQSSKYSIARSMRRKSTRSIKQENGYVVAIKMLHDTADQDQRGEFLKEIQLMKDVGSHRNIVNMLGCCTITEPMFLVVEYLPHGDLLHYLRKRRENVKEDPDNDTTGAYQSTYCKTYFNKDNPDDGVTNQKYVNTPAAVQKETKNGEIELLSVYTGDRAGGPTGVVNQAMMDELDEDDDNSITAGDMMAFAWQVSQGMEYLSKRGYVHRDLAARNVLVGKNKVAKVADFGLTRHMYEDLYQGQTNRKLPLKWMSVEAIFDQTFTSQSDVWAYGVFLWELVTLGGTPYPTINNRELLKLLREGYRMEKPETCDDELYTIMCSCWREKPEDRPTFERLRDKLEEMMTRDNPYFDPSAVDESRDYYNVPSFNSAPDPEETDDVLEVRFGETQPSKESGMGQSSDAPDESESRCLIDMSRDEPSEAISDYSEICIKGGDKRFHESEEKVNKELKNPEREGEKLALDNADPVVVDNHVNDNAISEKGISGDRKSLKYAQLDFEAMEFQLYRHRNQGLVL